MSISAIIEMLIGLGAVLLIIPSALLFIQSVAAMGRASAVEASAGASGQRASLAVLVPAHNEQAGIAHTLESVQRQLLPGDRIVVVADNCSDATAAIARAMGAEVLERHDLVLRGKGYALDHGVRHLGARPPGVVVIIDADCLMQPASLDPLVRLAHASQRPAQAVYLMLSPPAPDLKMRVAEFAWRVKNHARPLGMQRMGLPCELTGAGMAFPWSVIESAPLATGHLVEDMQLGLDLGAAGTPPMFCPGALVTSVFPERATEAVTQRTRWEHGHLSVILAQGPRLFWKAVVQRRGLLLAQVLDLCVPPLVLLLLLQTGMAVVAAAFALISGQATVLMLAGVGLMLLGGAIVNLWWRFGRDLVEAGELLKMPLYIGAKLPIYLKFLLSRQVEWVKTKRDGGSE